MLGGGQRERAGEGLRVAGVVGEQVVGDGHGCLLVGGWACVGANGRVAAGRRRPEEVALRGRATELVELDVCDGWARRPRAACAARHESPPVRGAVSTRSGTATRRAKPNSATLGNRSDTLCDMWEPVGPLPAADLLEAALVGRGDHGCPARRARLDGERARRRRLGHHHPRGQPRRSLRSPARRPAPGVAPDCRRPPRRRGRGSRPRRPRIRRSAPAAAPDPELLQPDERRARAAARAAADPGAVDRAGPMRRRHARGGRRDRPEPSTGSGSGRRCGWS